MTPFISILLSSLLLVSSMAHSVIPYVDPQPGENLWGLVSREGVAIDYLLDHTCSGSGSDTVIINNIYDTVLSISATVDNIYALDQHISDTLGDIYLIAQDIEQCCGTTAVVIDNIYTLEQSMSTTLDNLYALELITSATVNNIYILEQDISNVVDNIYILEQSMSTTLDNLYELDQDISATVNNIYAIVSNCCPCTFIISQSDIPAIITQPGYYCLSQDIIASTTAIIIMADDVTLDLKGHTIQTSSGDAVSANTGQRIIIHNGNVTAPNGIGISLVSTGTEIVVKDIYAYQCDTGFGVDSDAVNIRFDSCTAQGCVAHGFYHAPTVGVNLHTYSQCRAFTNGGYGFSMNYTGPLIVQNCLANQNELEGFFFVNTTQLTLAHSSALQNSGSGFSFSSVSNASISQCTAIQNGIALSQANGSGFYLNACNAVTCIECIALTNFGYGFSSQDGAPTQFFNNYAKENDQNGGSNFNILTTSGIVTPASQVFASYVVSWWTNVDGGL